MCSCHAIIKVSHCPHLFSGQFSPCKSHFAVSEAALIFQGTLTIVQREDFPSEELRFRSWILFNLKWVILISKRAHEANSLGGRVAVSEDGGTGGGLAEKPGCFPAAVSALGMCCCFWDVAAGWKG